MKEMYKGLVNSPETTITNDISNTDTLIYVLDDSRVPDDLPNLMTIGTGTNAETIKVVSKDGSAITVVRGFQGVAKAWNAGSIIARNFTEYDYNALMENINTLREDTDTNEQDLKSHKDDGAQHAKTARFVIGTSTAGWTAKDCDYLCDGTSDQVEINNAITALSASGGEIIILNGTYNITAKINVNKNNVSIRGNGNATILKRRWNSSSTEGVITLTSVEGCRVQNLQIDGNEANYASSNNYGIYLDSSSNNTITGNTCNNNSRIGICLISSSNNTVTGNTCIRGTGQTSDYTSNQYTILLDGSSNKYNLISSNNCRGKAVSISGGTGNSAWGNKFNATNDLP